MKINFFAIIAILAMCSLNSFANIPLGNGQIINVVLNDEVSSEGGSTTTATVLTDVKSLQGELLIKQGTPVILKIEKTGKKVLENQV